MEVDLPYLLTNKRVRDFFEKIKLAAVPNRISYEFLKKLGFTSSNDRGFMPLLKKLGFLDLNGKPTDRYKAYRQKGPVILAQDIRELYSELFSINEDINKKDRKTVKGVVSRVTGREAKFVDLITSTFMALCDLADFEAAEVEEEEVEEEKELEVKKKPGPEVEKIVKELDFRYNIEIHLPATTDIAVYNAIFKSLKEHLFD